MTITVTRSPALKSRCLWLVAVPIALTSSPPNYITATGFPNSNRGHPTYSSHPHAQYSSHLILDLSTLIPARIRSKQRQNLHTSSRTRSFRIAIQKAYLVSCTNSRTSDIAAAAEVLKDNKVAPGVKFYIAAASSVVQREAEDLAH